MRALLFLVASGLTYPQKSGSREIGAFDGSG